MSRISVFSALWRVGMVTAVERIFVENMQPPSLAKECAHTLVKAPTFRLCTISLP